MPQVKPDKTRRPVGLIVGVSVTVVVVLSLGGYLVWRAFPTATQTVREADALNAKGDYVDAYTKLKGAYGRAFTDSDRALILSRLAATTSNQSKLDEAYGYYQQLLKLAPNDYATLVSTGDLAVRLGHKSDAVGYYNRAIAILKQSQPGVYTKSEINRLTQQVAELEKQS